jgi:hypothetical protein
VFWFGTQGSRSESATLGFAYVTPLAYQRETVWSDWQLGYTLNVHDGEPRTDTDRNESFVVRDQSTSEILALIAQGKKPVCPVCRAPVLVAATPAQARELGIPLKMQCSRSERHIISEFSDPLPKVDKSSSCSRSDRIRYGTPSGFDVFGWYPKGS